MSYTPGESYFGRNRYVEYIAGNAPVILSAPHGGDLTPEEIPDRTSDNCGGTATVGRDLNTRELALAMQRRYFARFGRYPHVVINHLHRGKLDANRDPLEAACGDAEARVAWNESHDFLTTARATVVRASGRGWYMDMHSHGHPFQRLELGYLLRDDQLDRSDAGLDAYRAYEDTSSIRTMSAHATGLSFSALLRGASSLGTLYASNGFPDIPSSTYPSAAEGEAYFSGGYNTRRHTCGAEAGPLGGATRGAVCGVQIEANYTGVRDTQANMDRFGDATAAVLDRYLTLHWGLDLDAGRALKQQKTASHGGHGGNRKPRRTPHDERSRADVSRFGAKAAGCILVELAPAADESDSYLLKIAGEKKQQGRAAGARPYWC